MKSSSMIVSLCALLFFAACAGDKNGESMDNVILAVRALEADANVPDGEKLQVALLDATDIDSEADARAAADQAQWIPVDRFSSDALVFKGLDSSEANLGISGQSQKTFAHYRTNRNRNHDHYTTNTNTAPNAVVLGHQNHGTVWRPYYRDQWVTYSYTPPTEVVYYGYTCPTGYLLYQGSCVLPYTPSYSYYWVPRYGYTNRVSYRSTYTGSYWEGQVHISLLW